VLDTQRTLALVGLAHGHPARESPPAPAPEVVPWAAPLERAQGAQPAS
jgi:hypothetical protein